MPELLMNNPGSPYFFHLPEFQALSLSWTL